MKINNSALKPDKNAFFGKGRRKEAYVNVYLTPKGTGKITIINGPYEKRKVRDALDYFKDEFLIKSLLFPLSLINAKDNYNILAYVHGGGIHSQAEAIKLGIVRALILENFQIKPIFKNHSLLTQDTRCKERKKIGKYGARRSPQFTKR